MTNPSKPAAPQPRDQQRREDYAEWLRTHVGPKPAAPQPGAVPLLSAEMAKAMQANECRTVEFADVVSAEEWDALDAIASGRAIVVERAAEVAPVAWPSASSTNFEDDLYNKVPEPPMQAGTVCPMCGVNKPHEHTASEVIIFRNGEKRGRRNT